MSKNYYDILGVDKGASGEDIKKAYRKKAMEHHPDRGGDAEIFKEINEAYGVLGDENKKREYDTYGRVGGNPFGGGTGGFGGFGGVDVDLGDIFESFFGGSAGGRSRKKPKNFSGEDIETRINIDLKTSIIGGKISVKYQKYVKCNDCNQDGGTGIKTCGDCNGTGYVKYRQQTMFGTVEHTGACESCNGTGETLENVCKFCNGQKRIKKDVVYDLEIPAGIDDGMTIKITGEGNDGVKSISGDLYVRFGVDLKEKNLVRRGYDLYYELEIDVLEAILGTQKDIIIPVIGKRSITIESGTQIGTIIKKSGDGVKFIDKDKKGDLYIEIKIKIPKKLSDFERESYEKIAKEKKINFSNKKGIFEKIFS